MNPFANNVDETDDDSNFSQFIKTMLSGIILVDLGPLLHARESKTL